MAQINIPAVTLPSKGMVYMYRVKPYEEFDELDFIFDTGGIEWIKFSFNPSCARDERYFENKFFSGFRVITKKEYDTGTIVFDD